MEKVTTKKLALYTGRTHPALAEEVATHLGQGLGDPNIVEFSNGEIRPRFAQSVRGADVFIMQSHYGVDGRSVNDSIMEQLTMIDAASRASAKRITAVCPFYGYARQDRKAEGREPITARLVADMFKAAGAKRIDAQSSDTDRVRTLAWKKGRTTHVWLANLRDETVEVKLRGLGKGKASLMMLDEESFEQAARDPDFKDKAAPFTGTSVTLAPFAMARLDVTG